MTLTAVETNILWFYPKLLSPGSCLLFDFASCNLYSFATRPCRRMHCVLGLSVSSRVRSFVWI